MINSSFFRFVQVGLANTALGYGVILLLHYGVGVRPLPANLAGYVAGGLLSYTLNRAYTFASKRPHAEALPRFGFAVAGCVALNVMVLEFCLSVLALPVALAQAMAVVTYTMAFYLINRFIFSRR